MTTKPVLYYVGPGVKLGVPDRDLYPEDLEHRSKDALVSTGLYSEKPPKGRIEEPAEPDEAPAEPTAKPKRRLGLRK